MKPTNRYGVQNTPSYARYAATSKATPTVNLTKKQVHFEKTRIHLRALLSSRINTMPQPADFNNLFLYQLAIDVFKAGKKAIAGLAVTLQTQVFNEHGVEFDQNYKFHMLLFDGSILHLEKNWQAPEYFQLLAQEGMGNVVSLSGYLSPEPQFPNLPPQLAQHAPYPLFTDRCLRLLSEALSKDLSPFLLYHYFAVMDTAFEYKNKEQFDEALLWFKIAILLNPSLPYAYFQAGHIYITKQLELEKALEMYQQLLEVDPNLSETRENLAITYIVLGRMDEAFEQFDLCLKMNPANSQVHFLKAKFMLQLGRTAEAIDYCKNHFLDKKDVPDEAILAFLQSDPLIS